MVVEEVRVSSPAVADEDRPFLDTPQMNPTSVSSSRRRVIMNLPSVPPRPPRRLGHLLDDADHPDVFLALFHKAFVRLDDDPLHPTLNFPSASMIAKSFSAILSSRKM